MLYNWKHILSCVLICSEWNNLPKQWASLTKMYDSAVVYWCLINTSCLFLCVYFRAVGTFARALDCSSSVRQPSLHMSAAAASRDITLVSRTHVKATQQNLLVALVTDFNRSSVTILPAVPCDGHTSPSQLRPVQRAERACPGGRPRALQGRDGRVERLGGGYVWRGAREIWKRLQWHPTRLCKCVQRFGPVKDLWDLSCLQNDKFLIGPSLGSCRSGVSKKLGFF